MNRIMASMVEWRHAVVVGGLALLTGCSSEDAAAGAGCAGCGLMVAIPIALIALNIALLVWVARDAKARGMDSAVLWMLLVMFTSLIGLLIYLFSRPQGQLAQCGQCGNFRLAAGVKCPHCGSGVARQDGQTQLA
jgi:hypothetical protein